MKLGFTGTRYGMTPEQKEKAIAIVLELQGRELVEFHHGDCIGADAEMATALLMVTMPVLIVSHPCTLTEFRAHTKADETWPTLTPLARNRAIVDHCDLVIGAPPQKEEQKRGGTWYTIRYARKRGKLHAIVFPDGTVGK